MIYTFGINIGSNHHSHNFTLQNDNLLSYIFSILYISIKQNVTAFFYNKFKNTPNLRYYIYI